MFWILPRNVTRTPTITSKRGRIYMEQSKRANGWSCDPIGTSARMTKTSSSMRTKQVRTHLVRRPRPLNFLTKEIVGWSSQCIGTDAGQAGGMIPPYPAHNLLHKHNRFGLASLANLDKLPPKGAILIAAPLKIKSGTGSPIRALALVPKG